MLRRLPQAAHLPVACLSLLTLLTLIWLLPSTVNAQADSKGKEYWLTFLPNFHTSISAAEDSLFLFITAEEPTSGSIEYINRAGQSFNQPFELKNANDFYVFQTNYAGFELEGYNRNGLLDNPASQNERKARQAFHIVSESDITVYGLNSADASSDAFLALPADVSGDFYVVAAFGSDGVVSGDSLTRLSTPSQFAIVATEDDTEVVISPSTATKNNGLNDVRQVLNRGEVYLVQAALSRDERNGDLTGSIVRATRPIALFAGHQRCKLPLSGNDNTLTRDHLVQQIPPVSTWGKSAIALPFAAPDDDNGEHNDIYRIIAAFDGTALFIDGELHSTLRRGQFLEFPLTAAALIEASQPILVVQYRKTGSTEQAPQPRLGDPFMAIAAPIEQYLDSYTVLNAQIFNAITPSEKVVFEEQYISVVMASSRTGSLRVDGEALAPDVFTPIAGSEYSFAHLRVADGRHQLRADTGMGVFVYGYGRANSYGYAGGLGQERLSFDCSAFAGEDISICAGDSVELQGTGFGFGTLVRYRWDPPEGLDFSISARPKASPAQTTTYVLTVSDERGCRARDSLTVTVNPKPRLDAGPDRTICRGESLQLEVRPPEIPVARYFWEPSALLDNPDTRTPQAFPEVQTSYIVGAELETGCIVFDTLIVSVLPLPSANAGEDVEICSGGSTQLSASGGVSYEWTPAGSLDAPASAAPIASPSETTIYRVRVTDEFGCQNTDEVVVVVSPCEPCVSTSGVINAYSEVRVVNKPTRSVTVEDADQFGKDDLVLLIQMQGAAIASGQNEAYGAVSDIRNAGRFEFARVADVLTLNQIELAGPILNDYDPDGKLQLVRVPEYDHVTVTGRVRAKAWDGNTGGIVALTANCLILESDIDVSGAGFRGGEYINQSDCRFPATNDVAYFADSLCRFAPRGEGIARYGLPPNIYGRGAPANAGGGGNNHNAGGGGGAGAGAGGSGGFGFRGFPNRELAGGLGGYSLFPALQDDDARLFMGGGGGSGHANHDNGSGGAAGGGIIMIMAGSIRSNGDFGIKSRGMDAEDDLSTLNPDGCGGGGGGGSVLIRADLILENLQIDVEGGAGGSRAANLAVTSGPGGGGGGGVAILASPLEENDYDVVTRMQGGAAGELGIGSRNTYGARPGGEGRRIGGFDLPGSNVAAGFGPCLGCYPVQRNIEGGCGTLNFIIGDANYVIEELELIDPSRNVTLDHSPLNTLGVRSTISLREQTLGGEYYLRARNSNGKESLFRGSILPQPPTPTLTLRNDTLFIADTDPRPDSIQWYSEERGALPQQNRSNIFLVDSGYYWVCVWNKERCQAMSKRFAFNITTAVKESPPVAGLLRLFPNPARESITLEYESQRFEASTFRILDIFGSERLKQIVPAGHGTIRRSFDLARLSPGIYLLEVRHKDSAVMHRFIKQ